MAGLRPTQYDKEKSFNYGGDLTFIWNIAQPYTIWFYCAGKEREKGEHVPSNKEED